MVEVYVRLILAGRKTINDVPRSLKAAVQKRLDEINVE